MSFKLYLRKIWFKIRYSHFLRLLFDALSKLGICLTPYYVVQEGLFGKTIPELEKGFDDYDLGFMGLEDVRDLSLIPERHISERKLLERFQLGQRCFGVKFRGQPIAFNWFDFNEFRFLDHRFPLKEDEAYLFDAYTIVPFRGKGILPYVRYQSYKELAKIGKVKCYSGTNYFNTSSTKFKKKLHAQTIELHLVITIFRTWRLRFLIKRYCHM